MKPLRFLVFALVSLSLTASIADAQGTGFPPSTGTGKLYKGFDPIDDLPIGVGGTLIYEPSAPFGTLVEKVIWIDQDTYEVIGTGTGGAGSLDVKFNDPKTKRVRGYAYDIFDTLIEISPAIEVRWRPIRKVKIHRAGPSGIIIELQDDKGRTVGPDARWRATTNLGFASTGTSTVNLTGSDQTGAFIVTGIPVPSGTSFDPFYFGGVFGSYTDEGLSYDEIPIEDIEVESGPGGGGSGD